MRKEFLRESEGTLQGERSVPKLHCCNTSHGGESEKSHRWLVEMSGTSLTPALEALTQGTIKSGRDRDVPDGAEGESRCWGGWLPHQLTARQIFVSNFFLNQLEIRIVPSIMYKMAFFQ